jgi:hypothetical protein
MRYEICLHHVIAERQAGWNGSPMRLEVYADGETQGSLTKHNGGSDMWDLGDSCYRFSRQIQFALVQEDGSDDGHRLALFTVYAGETAPVRETVRDAVARYSLNYMVRVAHGVVLVRD